jgi:hypothetical protein
LRAKESPAVRPGFLQFGWGSAVLRTAGLVVLVLVLLAGIARRLTGLVAGLLLLLTGLLAVLRLVLLLVVLVVLVLIAHMEKLLEALVIPALIQPLLQAAVPEKPNGSGSFLARFRFPAGGMPAN